MEDIFKPQSLSIQKLLGDADSLYQIPRYQRPYKWGVEEVEKLWDDIWESFQEDEPNYFLGSVITAKPNENTKYLDIVDGQQRLTTLVIMFSVVRDLYPDINAEESETDPFAINLHTLKNSIQVNEKFGRLRLFTHSNHQSDFDNIIIKGDTLNCQRPSKKDLRNDEEPKFKFINTAAIFREKLTPLGTEVVGRLANYIFNRIKIIRIDCSSVSFAIKLFQVLNDRGLDLTNSDLIKSFLLGKLHKTYRGNGEMRDLRENQFLDDWKACEKIASNTDQSLNDLFVMYEYYLLEANPKKSLYDELEKQFELRDSNDVISDFKSFCSLYESRIYNEEDSLTYSFFYLPWSIYWRTILLTAMHSNYPEYEGLKKEFRRFYYLYWMAGNTLNTIKQFSFNLIKSIKEKKSLEAIQSEMENRMHPDRDNIYHRVQENLSGDIYFEKWCKPLLFMLEYFQSDSSNVNFLDTADRNIHVEHILPRSFKKNQKWANFHDDEEIESWVHSGANLTLLSGAKNIRASNDAFGLKIKAYKGKGFYEEGYEGVTSFRITQKIVDNFHSAVDSKEWNWQAIETRWNWFCGQVGALLEIDLTEIKHKEDAEMED